MSLGAHYRQVLQLSAEMLDAAKAEQWDSLIDLEATRSVLLQSAPRPGHKEAQESVADIIQEILATDAQTQEIVSTWQEHAKILLRIE